MIYRPPEIDEKPAAGQRDVHPRLAEGAAPGGEGQMWGPAGKFFPKIFLTTQF